MTALRLWWGKKLFPTLPTCKLGACPEALINWFKYVLSSQWHWCVSTLNKRRPFFFPFFRRTENIVLWPTGEAKKFVFLTRTDSSSHNDSQDFPNRFFATLNILGSQDSISTIFMLSLLVCRHFSPLQVKYIYFICK